MRARRFGTLAAIGLALVSNAPAQAPAFPEPGARVRVQWDGGRRPLIGRLKELRGDTLLAADSASGAVIAVPLSRLRALDVSRRSGPGVFGALVGGVLFGAVGYYLERAERWRPVSPEDLHIRTLGLRAGRFGVGGALSF